jgi:hypothetical protein
MPERRRIKPIVERLRADDAPDHIPAPQAHTPALEFLVSRGFPGVMAREEETDRDGEWVICEDPVEVRQ